MTVEDEARDGMTAAEAMPDELSPRHFRRRLLELGAIGVIVAVLVLVGPGLGSLRSRLSHAEPGWLVAGVALEVLSCLSYVVVFRAVFCPSMGWGLSYQIGMAEQAANALLPASGAGGLALGAWALHRGGMSTEHIGRRTVAFFLLTSLANVATLVVVVVLFAVGVIRGDRDPAVTYGFGAAAVIVTVLVLALPWLLMPKAPAASDGASERKLAAVTRFARYSLGHGTEDAILLLRRRSLGVLLGAFGVMAFDLAVLGVCFRAFGGSPPIGVLALGYLIGMLGGNIPVPGGIGGIDAGLIAVFALYGQPLAQTAAAVLVYHAIALWVPALLGTAAFVQLRRTLQREAQPAAMCMPLVAPIETVAAPGPAPADSRA
jgi:uncharacterized protein (TIRG00374 family)